MVVLVVGTASLAMSPGALAQEAEPVQPVVRGGQQVVTKVYSLRDLLDATAGVRPHESLPLRRGAGIGGGGGGGGGVLGGGGASIPDVDEATARAGQIISLITDTIDSDSWRDNGGTLGSMEYVPWTKSLVVTHTSATQAKIAELLANLAPEERMLTAQVVLVQMSEADLAESIAMEEGVTVFNGDVAGLKTISRMRVMGFDGENFNVASNRTISYIASLSAVVATSSAAFEPTVAVVSEGLTLQIRPELAQDAGTVRLTLTGEYVTLESMGEPKAVPPTTSGIGDSIETPIINRQSIDTRVRIPVNRWVVIGTLGASADGEADQPPMHILARIDASIEE